jgi:hypothetical protein
LTIAVNTAKVAIEDHNILPVVRRSIGLAEEVIGNTTDKGKENFHLESALGHI